MTVRHRVRFTQPVTFTNHTGVTIRNVTQGWNGTIDSVLEDSPSSELTYVIDWSGNSDPDLFDKIMFDYDGSGNYQSANGIAMGPQQIQIESDHPDATAHIIKFPMDETSGNVVIDDITGLTMTNGNSLHYYSKANAVGLDESDTLTTLAKALKDVSEGRLVFYFCVDFWEGDDARVTSYNNTKCSLHHYTGGQFLADGQGHVQNRNMTFSWAQDHLVEPDEAGAADQLITSLSKSFAADDPDSPLEWNGGSQAGAIVVDIGVPMGIKYIRHDGKVFPFDTLVSALPAEQQIFHSFPMNEPQPTGWTQITPTTTFVPSLKYMDCFAWGVYNFVEDVDQANDQDVVDFLSWLNTQARAGNKGHYSTWQGLK